MLLYPCSAGGARGALVGSTFSPDAPLDALDAVELLL